jgi:hypothetical protein
MIGTPRAAVMLLATAVAGVLLWIAAQFDRHTIGSYWAAYGIVAAAGLLFGVAQLRGRTGHPPAMFLFGFLPVLIAGGWVLLGMQPHGTWTRNHVLAWSGDIGIEDVVRERLHARRRARAGARACPSARPREAAAGGSCGARRADDRRASRGRRARRGYPRAGSRAGSVTGSAHAKRSQR